MTAKLCPKCDGNGYHYDAQIGEFTGYCEKCGGEGFVDDGFVNPRKDTFHVEIDVEVLEDAYFPDSVHKSVEELGWSYLDYPVKSDLLLQLLYSFFNKLNSDGITARSISVGKKVVHVNSIDLGKE